MSLSKWFYRVGLLMVFAPPIVMLVQIFTGDVVYDPNFQSGVSAMTGRLIDVWSRFGLHFITMVFGLITAFVFREQAKTTDK